MYDEYMKKVMPNPNMLPVRLQIQIPSKNVKLENIVMKPYENIEDLKRILCEYFVKRKDPLHYWGKVKVVLCGPLANGGDL